MPHRIFVMISNEVKKSLEEYKKEKGFLTIQEAVRDILGEWHKERERSLEF